MPDHNHIKNFVTYNKSLSILMKAILRLCYTLHLAQGTYYKFLSTLHQCALMTDGISQ